MNNIAWLSKFKAFASRWYFRLHQLAPYFALAVLAIAIWFLYHILKLYSVAEILTAIDSIPRSDLMMACAATFGSYLVLSFYDFLGFFYIRHKISIAKVAIASFTAFAIGNSIGMASIAGSTVRLRFYASYGIKTSEILRLIAFITVSFWLGFHALAGIALLVHPLNLPEGFSIPPFLMQFVGLILLSVTIIYLAICIFRRRPIAFFGEPVAVPHVGLAVAQIIVASFDWLLAAITLYFLLPHQQIPFDMFLSVFVSAQVIALLAHVPGGVGVLEGLIIYFVGANHQPTADIMAGLLAFRAIYYLIPLLIGSLIMLHHELGKRRRAKSQVPPGAGVITLPIAKPIKGSVQTPQEPLY